MLIGMGLLTGTSTPPPARNTNPLSQISGVQANWDLDATLSASYSGSGTNWANIITSPDDGTAQAGYDFSLVSSPTFTGSANDAAAYFLLGGANSFQLASGSNTATLKNLAKTTGGAPFTAIFCYQLGSTASSNFYGTARSGASNHGFYSTMSSSTVLNGIEAVAGVDKVTGSTVSTMNNSTPYLFAIAADYTGGTFKSALNSRSFSTKTLTSAADTTDASNAFQIGRSGSNSAMPNLTRIYGHYLFNKILSDADLSNVVTVLNSRHNRTYA